MTKICVYKKGSHIVKYVVEGHTGFAEAGADIVCAAVSAVATHTLNGLTEIVEIAVGFEVKDAYLECIVPDSISEEERKQADILLDSMYLTFKNLEEQYKEYITIIDMEV